MRFVTVPDRRAANDPEGPAIADRARALTNRQLLDAVLAAARRLDGLGLGPRDVIALKLSNRIELVVLLFAAWRIGATVTPVNPALTDSEVARQLSDSGARLLVVEPTDTGEAGVPVLSVDDVAGPPGTDPVPHHDPAALALLIYTSGTTGAPKGVMLDHANLDAMAAMGRGALELGPTDRSLLVLPLFHVNGIVVSVLTPLLVGASVVIAERFSPTTFFHTVERERPTFFSAVPTIYSMLAALPEDVRPDTSSLRFAVCGAAPASPGLLARFENRYGFPITEGYGLSEATCGSTLNPLRGPRKAGTVGLPFPGQDLRVVGPHCEVLPPGLDGEVVLRGANVMRGYLGRPEDTAATIVDGWLRTGDVGHLDDDGYLTLVGRSKEMIIRGGENIYPKEVEDVLTSHRAVLDAAVIGVPDETWGEVVAAFVQARPGASVDLSALKALCRSDLSAYKRPTIITVLESLPRNAVGKHDKNALRALTTTGKKAG
jgi:long-chain acyl-CoA synthetase